MIEREQDRGGQAGCYDGSNTTGFVSPAADALEGPVDLAAMLDLRRPHRYPVRVLGQALVERGILPGDVLIADTAAPPRPGRVAIVHAHIADQHGRALTRSTGR